MKTREISLQPAYTLLHVSTPSELARKFIEEDQKHLKARTWDYKNPDLVINKVKEIVERAISTGLFAKGEQDTEDLQDMLWFWYHHAIGYAIWGEKDKTKAQEFSKKALHYQIAENPNKITRLLYLLVHDRHEEATTWLKKITEEPDKTAAQGVMVEYDAGNFFKS